MLGAVSRLARQEAGKVARDAVRRVIFFAVAMIFVALALIFGGLALFLWLSTMMAPELAGLAVAGIALVIALIALLLAGRRRSRAKPALLVPEPSAAEEERRMAEAEALGIMIGRDLKGFPLVAAALAIGIVVGRLRR